MPRHELLHTKVSVDGAAAPGRRNSAPKSTCISRFLSRPKGGGRADSTASSSLFIHIATLKLRPSRHRGCMSTATSSRSRLDRRNSFFGSNDIASIVGLSFFESQDGPFPGYVRTRTPQRGQGSLARRPSVARYQSSVWPAGCQGALLVSSPALDVRLPTALQVLQTTRWHC